MIKYKARMVFQMTTVAGSLILINVAYFTSYILRFWGMPPNENFGPYLVIAPFITLAAATFLITYDLQSNLKKDRAEILSSVFCIVFLVSVSAVTISYFFGKFAFPRTVFMISGAIQFALLTVWFNFMKRVERAAHGTKNVIVIGEAKDCLVFSERLEEESSGLYTVKGFVSNGCETEGIDRKIREKILAEYDNFKEKLYLNKDDIFIICSEMEHNQKMNFVYFCLQNNISLFIVPQLYEIVLSQSKVISVADSMLFSVGELQLDSNFRTIKRLMDLGVAGLGLIFLSIPMIIVSLIIKFDSKGPIFYTQERVGENGKVFKLYKFRTMVQDAEKATGPVLATGNDSRVTKVGKFLRATRLDELPQLLNVLIGEMSLVGPRPERPHFVDQYVGQIPSYALRTLVKGGITGLAQVSGKYSSSPQDKLRYDLIYAKSYSPVEDLRILFQTLKVILLKDRST